MLSLLFHYHYFSVAYPVFGYEETTEEGNQQARSNFAKLSEIFLRKSVNLMRCSNLLDF